MTTVGLVSQFFPPERNAPANRVSVLASTIASHARAKVVTVFPSYPDPDAFCVDEVVRSDSVVPYKIHRLPAFDAHGGSFSRAIREMCLAEQLVARAISCGIDVLWVSAPSMFLIPAGQRQAASAGIPVVVDLRDLTWEYLADSEVFESSLHRFAAPILKRWMEDRLRRVDVITTTNSGATEVLVESGVPSEKVIPLANGIDARRFNELSRVAKIPVSKRFTVTYCGLVGHNQGLATLVDVARELPAVKFMVAGAGPELSKLRRYAADGGVGNVQFLGQISWKEVLALYEASDVLFAQLRGQDSLSRSAVPSKIYEYMSAGRPMVYAGRGVASRLVSDLGTGLTVDADDAQGIVVALKKLHKSKRLRSCLARAGRDAARASIREDLAEAAVPKILQRVSR